MMKKYSIMFAAALFAIFVLTLTNAAVIKTVPEQTIWYANNVTQYKVHVYADNTGLNGEQTGGIQWRFLNNIHMTNVGRYVPTQNDFYEGFSMLDNWVYAPGQLSSRLTDSLSGPANHEGYLGTYEFVVPVGTVPGQYSFDLADTIFLNQNADPQPHTIENVQFTIRKPLTVKVVQSTKAVLPIDECDITGC